MPVQGNTIRLTDNEICTSNGTFARDVLEGLIRTPKSLPCKYFYDMAKALTAFAPESLKLEIIRAP
jgi:uncharacterized SAM-dependent methyltransferase